MTVLMKTIRCKGFDISMPESYHILLANELCIRINWFFYLFSYSYLPSTLIIHTIIIVTLTITICTPTKSSPLPDVYDRIVIFMNIRESYI